ncbi:phage tail protein, P2 protein I family [Paraburkholderia megapolitana]|uniref:Phage tail protein, P2 protein I family n=2 Tax=Paraburkholderia megapolitana TaxID=420953 RepID=A0A1I3U5C2_9BURK|nr:phage tail protein, P2 protein I family [Paraburkholderia megapolitana]
MTEVPEAAVRMPGLLPVNSTPLERSIAATTARTFDIPVPLADLMNPDTIPLALLPWLAWHLGVDTWKDYWPEQVKRARVKAAIPIARKRGTAAAVRDVVATFGANIAMREWFELEPPGVRGTFEIVMTVSSRDGTPATAAYVADIIAEIDRVKRASAHYTFTQGLSMQGTQRVAAAVRPALYRRLSLTD